MDWFTSVGSQKHQSWKSEWLSLHKLDQDHTVVIVRQFEGLENIRRTLCKEL